MTDPHPATYPSGIPRVEHQRDESGDVLIVTGMAGAGRTRAAGVLADLGWYVVDNLPPHMLNSLLETLLIEGQMARVAAVVDARGGRFFGDLEPVIDDIEARGVTVRVVFLDANDDVLVRRFEEARRPHPLSEGRTLLEGIQEERDVTAPVRDVADAVIDTSTFSIHDLRRVLSINFGDELPTLNVNVQSFGFKNGVPTDADYVADVRFLPNPHWVPEMRALTGLDEPVRDYVLNSEGAAEFLDNYTRLLSDVLRRYRAHDRVDVTVSVGCTGGKHRSVAIAEALGARLQADNRVVRVTHRDRPTS
ncbi:RNase adapter RapZ [Demequina sediminicola]|uniref:RNase adapter RapZ n=1 Tax=Demequina sediminicola TaxID=1095026 RepID=UPI0009E5B021|nr:RNase adapter RapZ [Demequina sediminicola]